LSDSNATLVIRGKMLIDGLGTPPARPGLVAISGKRIVYAGKPEAAPPAPEAQIIDLPEACLLLTRQLTLMGLKKHLSTHR